MKLLIITQKVDINDDILGFFHRWIEEFARHCESIIVICLQKGEYDLPKNVKILSLGKEQKNFQFSIFNFQSIFNFSIFKKIKYLLRFWKYIFVERKNYDSVFVHMNPEYVALGGLLWKLWNKKIILWYTHKAVNFKLRLAEKLADKIFTVSKESFCLASKKIKIIGHGIDLDKFKRKMECRKQDKKFRIISVGRISPIKNLDLLIDACDILKKQGMDFFLDIIGAPAVKDDERYFEKLKKIIEEKNLTNIVKFIGSVPYKDIVGHYAQADLSVNLCPTGGMDKAVLESMACGIPVIVFNKTFSGMMAGYESRLILENKDKAELAKKIKDIIVLDERQREEIGLKLRHEVEEKHNLSKLVKTIINHL